MRRSAIAVLTAVLVAVAAVVLWSGTGSWREPATPPCSGSAGKGRVGGSPGAGILGLSDADLGRELDAAQQAGMWAIRLDVDWARIEPERGTYDWAATDRVVAAVTARGMCAHGLIGHTPRWAVDPADHPSDSWFRPQDPSDFGGFAAEAAGRYRESIAVWEIWNEPNTVNFFKPAPDPAAYTALLASAYRAIKAVSDDLTVISGGLAPAVDNGRDIAPVTFLSSLYALGANRYFDAFAMHPYTYPALPNDERTRHWSSAQQMWPMRDIMVAGGDAAKQVWLTEFGAPTGDAPVAVTDAVQADTIRIVLQAARDVGWIGPAFVYSLRDSGDDLTDPEQNFGILHHDFTPKPAFAVVRQFGAAQP